MGETETGTGGPSPEVVGGGSLGGSGGGRDGGPDKSNAPRHYVPWPLTCVGAALKTKAGWGAILLSIAVTTLGLQGGGNIVSVFEPVGLTVYSVSVHGATAGRLEVSLAVRASVVVSNNCTTETFFGLLQTGTSPPSVYPLGQIIAGKGFSTPWRTPYDVRLSVPSGIPAGSYDLATRAVYACQWFGFLTSRITNQAPIQKVVLP